MDVNEAYHPGAVKYGNFINYYQFNPATERLKHLPKDSTLIQHQNTELLCLDVGCNSGELTVALYEHLSEAQEEISTNFLAIDLDETLILRSNESNKYAKNIEFKICDITNLKSDEVMKSYLQNQNSEKFDCVFCFSTSMWIHINYGDNALKLLLEKLAHYTSKYLFIEPQPWKCYSSAARRMRRLKQENFELSKLKIRDIESFIIEFLKCSCGMELVNSFGSTSWGRKILQFQKLI